MNIDKKALGQRIKSIRQAKGLTMEEFGKFFDNASKGVISNWEKGSNIPNNARLKMIAQFGGITVNELLYGDFESYCYGIFDAVNAEMGWGRGLDFLTDPDRKRAFYAKVFGYVKEYRYGYENSEGINNLYFKSFSDELNGLDLSNEGSFTYLTSKLEMLKNELRKYYYTSAVQIENSKDNPGETKWTFSEGTLREGADLELYKKQEKILDVARSEVSKLKVGYKKEEK